jgi:hypothetical protein
MNSFLKHAGELCIIILRERVPVHKVNHPHPGLNEGLMKYKNVSN